MEFNLNEQNKEIEELQRRLILRGDKLRKLQNNGFSGDENLEEIKIRYIDLYIEQKDRSIKKTKWTFK